MQHWNRFKFNDFTIFRYNCISNDSAWAWCGSEYISNFTEFVGFYSETIKLILKSGTNIDRRRCRCCTIGTDSGCGTFGTFLWLRDNHCTGCCWKESFFFGLEDLDKENKIKINLPLLIIQVINDWWFINWWMLSLIVCLFVGGSQFFLISKVYIKFSIMINGHHLVIVIDLWDV